MTTAIANGTRTLTRIKAIKAIRFAERLSLEAIVRGLLTEQPELVAELFDTLRELRRATEPIQKDAGVIVGELLGEYGEPHPETGEPWIPEGSFADQILHAKIQEYMQQGVVEIRSTLDLEATRDALGIPKDLERVVS